MAPAAHHPRTLILAAMLTAIVCASGAHAQSYDLNSARVNYILQCQGCHRADGNGAVESTPSMVTDGKLFLSSPAGRAFFVSVPGVVNAPLSDEDLTGVINYVIEHLIIKDGDFERLLYTVLELGAYRAAPQTEDVTERRRVLIAKLKRGG